MFHSRGGRQFQRVEVRVGDDDPGNEYSSIKDRNTFCSSFLDKGKQMKYYDFECSKYGLKGKYITLSSSLASNQKERYDVFSAAEVELFGNICLIPFTLNITTIFTIYETKLMFQIPEEYISYFQTAQTDLFPSTTNVSSG